MSKDIFIQLTHDLDFLIVFQQKIARACKLQGMPEEIIDATTDILTILEAMNESGVIEHLPTIKES